jgi:hypothetical protein
MSNEKAVRTLRSLRDEISRDYSASTRSILHHAMMLSIGEPPHDPPEPWKGHSWPGFTRNNFRLSPIITDYTSRNAYWRRTQICFFGRIGRTTLKRFSDQAVALIPYAVEVVSAVGRDFRPLPYALDGRIYFCYCMAWEYDNMVTYKIKNYELFANHVTIRISSFFSMNTFEQWQRREVEVADGLFFAMLSRDVRSCTVSAIDALLSIADESVAERAKSTRRKDLSNEERNK